MQYKLSVFKGIAAILLVLCSVLPAMAESAAVEKPAAGAGMQKLVNINTADAAELMTLPGIGPKTADSIIDYRSNVGSFASVDDLMKVKGIGAKKLEKLRPYLTLKNEAKQG